MKVKNKREIGSTLVRAIGRTAGRLPSASFLVAALGSLAASAVLHRAGKKWLALAVGEVMPTLLLFSLYRKTASRMNWPGFHLELRPGSAKWEGPSEEPAANVSAAATPGVPL